MMICLMFTGALAWGLIKIKVESRTEKLYVPPDSKAERDLEAASNYFTVQNRIIKVGRFSMSREIVSIAFVGKDLIPKWLYTGKRIIM